MADKLISVEAIFKFLELILSVIIGGLIGDIPSASNISKTQVVDVGIYGFLIVNLLLVYSIIVKFEIPKNTRLAIAGIGILVYIICGALILEYFDIMQGFYDNPTYGRLLSAGIFSIFQAVVYIGDAFFVFKS